MKRDTALWMATLASPLAWVFAFLAKFFLAHWICVFGWKPAVFGISLAALAMSAGGGWLAWTQWQGLNRDGSVSRAGVMAMVAVLLNAFFFVVLIAGLLPEWMLGGCE